METYRLINRELSLHNQELRTAINKLKHEIMYLNEQLLEQREQFNRMKDSIANVLEDKYKEMMLFIYPERFNRTKPSITDLSTHRRSNDNVTVAGTLRKHTYSPPAKRTLNSEVQNNDETCSPAKTLNASNASNADKNSLHNSDEQTSLPHEEEAENSTVSDVSDQSLNHSLQTISEEASAGDLRNETVTDTTINNLLEAPCSTPYNPNKNETVESTILADTSQLVRSVRVLLPKMSAKKMELLKLSTRTETIPKPTTPLKQKVNERLSRSRVTVKRSKNASKENIPSEAENTYLDDELSIASNSNGKLLRPKRKTVNMKEPSLRQKLRNTTNLKIK